MQARGVSECTTRTRKGKPRAALVFNAIHFATSVAGLMQHSKQQIDYL
jgi:hypothetical protein